MSSVARRRPVDSESDDDGDPINQSLIRKSTVSVVNPVIVVNNDGKAPLPFKRENTYVGSTPPAVNPVAVASDDNKDKAPRPYKKATIHVKNNDWGLHSSRRANISMKYKPALSHQKTIENLKRIVKQCHAGYTIEDGEGDDVLDRLTKQDHHDTLLRTEQSEGDDKTRKNKDDAKSGSENNGGRPKKKQKSTITPVPATENTMLMGQKAPQQGQQYSISRCLEVLHGMDDVSDEIKVLASDVLKDAASREFFMCYESRLRGLWLKKEVAKLGAQLPAWAKGYT